jgi:hypothetical protein
MLEGGNMDYNRGKRSALKWKAVTDRIYFAIVYLQPV